MAACNTKENIQKIRFYETLNGKSVLHHFESLQTKHTLGQAHNFHRCSTSAHFDHNQKLIFFHTSTMISLERDFISLRTPFKYPASKSDAHLCVLYCFTILSINLQDMFCLIFSFCSLSVVALSLSSAW